MTRAADTRVVGVWPLLALLVLLGSPLCLCFGVPGHGGHGHAHAADPGSGDHELPEQGPCDCSVSAAAELCATVREVASPGRALLGCLLPTSGARARIQEQAREERPPPGPSPRRRSRIPLFTVHCALLC